MSGATPACRIWRRVSTASSHRLNRARWPMQAAYIRVVMPTASTAMLESRLTPPPPSLLLLLLLLLLRVLSLLLSPLLLLLPLLLVPSRD